MRNDVCPVCGSNTLKKRISMDTITEPFGGRKDVETVNYKCETCDSTGDFFNENDNIILDSMKELKHLSVKNILNDFVENEISMSSIERALELPQRTLTKWKNNNSAPSASGIALMKFIRIFPWLLEVAENKYDYNDAQKIHIKAAIQRLLSVIKFREEDFTEAGIVATSKATFIYMNYQHNYNAETEGIGFIQNTGMEILSENPSVATT